MAIDSVSRKEKATVPLDFTPGPVVFAEGSIWIVDEGGDRVVRIDPVTRRVEARVAVGHDPVDVAFGAGAVWVANHFGRSVSRIDPGSNKVVRSIKVEFMPLRIGAGDQAVWVDSDGVFPANGPPVSTLATIEPATNRVIDSTSLTSPCAPLLGPATDGGWAATAFGEVWRLGPRGGQPVALTRTSGTPFAGTLVDEPRGTIWFGSDGSPGRVLSLDLVTKDFSESIPVGTTADPNGPGCTPIGVTIGGNYLWVTNADDHTLSVIAGVTRQGVGTLPLKGKPTGLAFGVDQLWVTMDLP